MGLCHRMSSMTDNPGKPALIFLFDILKGAFQILFCNLSEASWSGNLAIQLTDPPPLANAICYDAH